MRQPALEPGQAADGRAAAGAHAEFLSLGLFVIQPAVFSAVGMLLSHAAGNAMPDLVYTVIGGGIMGMWSGIVFTSTFDITGDRYNGMLGVDRRQPHLAGNRGSHPHTDQCALGAVQSLPGLSGRPGDL